MTAALEVAGLRVDHDATARLVIDRLEVASGEVVVITGPTDSGKTLLAAALSGRVHVSAGVVSVVGRRLSGGVAARRRQGLAVTIADGGRIAGCSVGEALRLAGSHRMAAALERFPLLSHRVGVRAELLSGGEQQLLQVACAWSGGPRVLLLDAPTTGLADDVSEQVRQLARDAAAEGTAVLWLDQTAEGAPVIAGWRLTGGVLSAVPAAASPSDPA